MNYTALAIQTLSPNSEFVITNEDYSSIIWHWEGEPPSKSKVEAEIIKIKQNEIAAAEAKAAARASALAKLAALGLSADEIAAL